MSIDIALHICLLLGGCAMIGAGVYIVLRCKRLRSTGLVREAVVCREGGGEAPGNGTTVLEYHTAQGKFQVRTRYFCGGLFFPFEAGDTVRIFYDSDDFRRFYVDGDRLPGLLSVLFIGLGLVMLQVLIVLHLF